MSFMKLMQVPGPETGNAQRPEEAQNAWRAFQGRGVRLGNQ